MNLELENRLLKRATSKQEDEIADLKKYIKTYEEASIKKAEHIRKLEEELSIREEYLLKKAVAEMMASFVSNDAFYSKALEQSNQSKIPIEDVLASMAINAVKTAFKYAKSSL
jgi:hypothetical protein